MLPALAPPRFDDVNPPILQGSSTPPVRTCVGCRRRDERSALLRVVLTAAQADITSATRGDGAARLRVTPDPRGRLPGRGAWLHPSQACFDQAVRRRAFARALRVSAALDVSPIREYLAASPQA